MKPAILIVFLAGICGSSAAVAAPVNFYCSAPLRRSPEISQDRPGGPPFRIRGRILPRQLDPLPTNPQQKDGYTVTSTPARGAEVAIFDHDQGTSVKFVVQAGPQADTMEIGYVKSRDEENEILLVDTVDWAPSTGVSIPFDLSIEAAVVVLRTGPREIPFEIALGPNSQIWIGCSGGDFEFEQLEISD